MTTTGRYRCAWLGLALALTGRLAAPAPGSAAEDRPNVLWITCEDMSPNLRCYGDAYAVSPNLDRLAEQGVRYTHVFAPIGVCAPSRSSLFLGMYASSAGTQHMRCEGTLPPGVEGYPWHLRRAGYYCTNNVKTDYNLKPSPGTWDQSSAKAHWRNRKPGQPFFAVFNLTITHESQIRAGAAERARRARELGPEGRHDPARAPLPPYHPDTPEVRRDWASYYDTITLMDRQAGAILADLEADGLADDTIVFFYSDHGAGMPRSKRWLYESSTRVPLIVRFPEKYRQLAPDAVGTTTDRLVSFVDLGPTVLSLAGVPTPDTMQGVPFLGRFQGEPRRYVHGFRDRMDERSDLLRTVRDRRYRYIRNFHPERPWFQDQYISYLYEMPTMQVWQRLSDAGQLDGPAAAFMARSKPIEELYDSESDLWEVNNLAGSPAHREVLERLRAECRRWQAVSVDLGLLPEADLRARFGSEAPYAAVRRDPSLYPFERIATTADLANARASENVPALVERLRDEDPAVRYWAAVGLGSLAESPGEKALGALSRGLSDPAGWVRVAAAEALCRHQQDAAAVPELLNAMDDPNAWVRLEAINVLDRLDERAKVAEPRLRQALDDPEPYVVRVAHHALEPFGGSGRTVGNDGK